MSADETSAGTFSASRLAALERACELGLREHLPGLEIVDRHLELYPPDHVDGAARHVDLLAVDASGRVILITFTDGSSDETLLVACESVAFARIHADVLARHVGSLRAGADAAARRRPPLSVLVAESFAPRLLDKLALVPARELSLFEVLEVKSGGGASVGFQPVQSSRAGAGASPGVWTPEQFVAVLPAAERAYAESLLRRLPRLDDGLTCVGSEESLLWRSKDRDLCRLDRGPEGLLAWAGTESEPIRLLGMADVEELLDRVIRGHLGAPEERPAGPERSSVALLTPDEIAAFRD